MKSSRIRFWVYALPLLSLFVAVSSVGFQYYKVVRVAAELKKDEAEIRLLVPKSTESYDPNSHDKPQ